MKTFIVPFNVKIIGSVCVEAETVEEAATKTEQMSTEDLIRDGEAVTRNTFPPEEAATGA